MGRTQFAAERAAPRCNLLDEEVISVLLELEMRMLPIACPRRTALALALLGTMIAGCGGSGSPFVAPISVSLSPSTVVVPQDGAPTHIQIYIKSTSETALVTFTGLPGGVQTTYAATDTNPSGSLTFMATAKAAAGTYMPIVNVNSAGQTATVKFTLIVSGG